MTNQIAAQRESFSRSELRQRAAVVGLSTIDLLDSYIILHISIIIISVSGLRNFIRDIELMIGPKPRVFWIYWVAMWLVVTPLVIVVCTIYYTYGPKISHPKE